MHSVDRHSVGGVPVQFGRDFIVRLPWQLRPLRRLELAQYPGAVQSPWEAVNDTQQSHCTQIQHTMAMDCG